MADENPAPPPEKGLSLWPTADEGISLGRVAELEERHGIGEQFLAALNTELDEAAEQAGAGPGSARTYLLQVISAEQSRPGPKMPERLRNLRTALLDRELRLLEIEGAGAGRAARVRNAMDTALALFRTASQPSPDDPKPRLAAHTYTRLTLQKPAPDSEPELESAAANLQAIVKYLDDGVGKPLSKDTREALLALRYITRAHVGRFPREPPRTARNARTCYGKWSRPGPGRNCTDPHATRTPSTSSTP
ncbi:MAG: hypothetical protein M0026_21795 [Nocardiopsaceae bacterium]|nr:hypothetical protein [Nocardiopsaceae bacterium]